MNAQPSWYDGNKELKLEVGMWVRMYDLSPEGQDGLVVLAQLTDANIIFMDNPISQSHIIKASHKIVDVLEIGDVVLVISESGIKTYWGIDDETDLGLLEQYVSIGYIIKSVLTKEQYEQYATKVGE